MMRQRLFDEEKFSFVVVPAFIIFHTRFFTILTAGPASWIGQRWIRGSGSGTRWCFCCSSRWCLGDLLESRRPCAIARVAVVRWLSATGRQRWGHWRRACKRPDRLAAALFFIGKSVPIVFRILRLSPNRIHARARVRLSTTFRIRLRSQIKGCCRIEFYQRLLFIAFPGAFHARIDQLWQRIRLRRGRKH